MTSSNSTRLFGIAGSLRKDSFSKAVLKALGETIAPHAELTIGDIGTLPLYNQDLDGDNSPEPVLTMRKAVAQSQGLLIVTPEYNYGIPGVLKNAIDWLSRPAYKSALIGKPFLVVSCSPAFTGGVRAQAPVREALMAALAQPVMTGEIVITSVNTKITEGRFTDKTSIDFAIKGLQKLVADAQTNKAQAA